MSSVDERNRGKLRLADRLADVIVGFSEPTLVANSEEEGKALVDGPAN